MSAYTLTLNKSKKKVQRTICSNILRSRYLHFPSFYAQKYVDFKQLNSFQSHVINFFTHIRVI